MKTSQDHVVWLENETGSLHSGFPGYKANEHEQSAPKISLELLEHNCGFRYSNTKVSTLYFTIKVYPLNPYKMRRSILGYITRLSGALALSFILIVFPSVYPSYGVRQLFGSPTSSPDIHDFARNDVKTLFTSNGLTDVVQWDNYSLIVKGQRIFLQYVCSTSIFKAP